MKQHELQPEQTRCLLRALVAVILTHRPHPEQGFRTCLGILRLYSGIEPARAEAVSARALEIGAMKPPVLSQGKEER